MTSLFALHTIFSVYKGVMILSLFQRSIHNVVSVKDSDKWCQNTILLAEQPQTGSGVNRQDTLHSTIPTLLK